MKEIRAEKFTSSVIAPQIIENKIHDNVNMGKDDFFEMRSHNLALSDGKPYCLLIQIGYFAKMTDEFRHLTLKRVNQRFTFARAIMVQSLGHRLAGNFYIRVNKPETLTRLFTDKDNAINWLKKQVNRQHELLDR